VLSEFQSSKKPASFADYSGNTTKQFENFERMQNIQ